MNKTSEQSPVEAQFQAVVARTLVDANANRGITASTSSPNDRTVDSQRPVIDLVFLEPQRPTI